MQGKLSSLDFNVTWYAFISAHSEQKAISVINQLSKKIGRKFIVENCEHYWKDQSLFSTKFSLQLESQSISDAMMETLVFCKSIAEKWVVSAPSDLGNGAWQFIGDALKPNDDKVNMIYFVVSNHRVESKE